MTAIVRPALLAIAFAAAQITPQCGSSSTTAPTTGTPASTLNMQSVLVNPGPNNDYANGLFTSVTVCVPGTSSCQLISGILVDTGSSGLRVLSSALNNLNLPQQTATDGGPVVECAQFQDGFTWGPVQTADVKLAGETASSAAIQVIGSPSFSTIPSGCANSGGAAEDSLDTLSANGILGVGLFRDDCGAACASSGSSNPGFYYSCPSSGCIVIAQPSAKQLQNPVSTFASDNNGVVIQLPSVATGGAATLTGSLIFGIGTQSDNALGSAMVYTTDGAGNFTTIFNGQSIGSSFIDSGSNGFFFVDAATSGLPLCPDTSDFYCPASRQSLSATTRGANGTTSTVSFAIDNADTLLRVARFSVFGELGGPNAGSFDWGLPFFYGRSVFTAIEGQSTPGGVGPYFAF